jgi:hypothetical protein
MCVQARMTNPRLFQSRENKMRAETQALIDEIKGALSLIRRHL